MSERVYRSLEPLTKEEIEELLEKGNEADLLSLPFSVGMCSKNWKEAQSICLELMEHQNPAIRANAAMGLSYIARTHQKLEKNFVKPYLLRELRENAEFEWRIRDAIADINMFMGWNLASKHDI